MQTLLPRGEHPNPLRVKNQQVNEFITKEFIGEACNEDSAKWKNVHVVQIDDRLLKTDGTLPHYLAHDFLHLTQSGYQKTFTPVYYKLMNLLYNKEL